MTRNIGKERPTYTGMVLFLSSLLLSVGLTLGTPFYGMSQERTPLLSSTNPAFLENGQSRIQSLRADRFQEGLTREGRKPGYRPSPVNLSHLKEQAAEDQVAEQHTLGVRPRLGLPVSYDLRSQG